VSFIEDYIRERVLPLYANTHTEASATGRCMTALREDARRLIHRAVTGGADDAVIFCGSGSTAAIDRLVRIVELGRRERAVDVALARADVPIKSSCFCRMTLGTS
jgi:selenocysteine lyase/cysteine desulfurase